MQIGGFLGLFSSVYPIVGIIFAVFCLVKKCRSRYTLPSATYSTHARLGANVSDRSSTSPQRHTPLRPNQRNVPAGGIINPPGITQDPGAALLEVEPSSTHTSQV
jgi:hypothetical protein